jgi:hypothetical protein
MQLNQLINEWWDTSENLDTLLKQCSKLGFSYTKTENRYFKLFSKKERWQRRSRLLSINGSRPGTGRFGEKNWYWKGGKQIDEDGYIIITPTKEQQDLYGKNQMYEHILVYLEANNLDKLPKGYALHHIDKDKANNNLENLQLLTNSEHVKLHARESSETIERIVSDVSDMNN